MPSANDGWSRTIPDLKRVNRNLPIADVARRLGLRFGHRGMIHCWHPDRHQHGDRTPSVGIRATTNKAKCFGCSNNPPPMSVVDLVMDVWGMDVRAAATWLEDNFEVPRIGKGKHLKSSDPVRAYMVGHEQPIEL